MGSLPDVGNAGDTGANGDTGGGCVAGAACTTNPGAPCRTGRTTCVGGQVACTDGDPAKDATTCATGLCTRGACLGESTVSTAVDLSQASITSGRTCAAEAPAFSVTALDATHATLSAPPDAGCLATGDEVMLIDLQGSPSATSNVGNWELLEVGGGQGTVVTFAAAKTRSYGASGDTGIGVGATDQKWRSCASRSSAR